MSGIDDLIPRSDDRWTTATRRAQGIADLVLGRALKTYYTVYLPAGVIFFVGAGAVLGIFALGGATPDWPSLLVFGFILAVLGATIGGLRYNAKKVAPAAKTGRVDVLLSLEDEERKDIRRQILGKRPVNLDHLSFLGPPPCNCEKISPHSSSEPQVLPPIFTPQLLRGGTFISWLIAAGVAVLVIGSMLVLRDFQRAGSFLDRTAEPAVTGPPE